MIGSIVREKLEEREELLSPFAVRSRLSKGRQRAEEPCNLRTAFQRDRDRIIHSMAFRRLKHKTQVFLAPVGDHFVTRLTHTLEVAQIARTISRSLNLNEDLTEAIALGHDLGHTPFGHVGEEVLASLVPNGFRHNEQSLRVVDILERDGKGLNLTWEVRDGILNHSKMREGILAEGRGSASTLEGQVCKVADSVAYINHDLEDAVRAGIVDRQSLPPIVLERLGQTHSQRINTLVCDIVEYSWLARGEGDLASTSGKASHPSKPIISDPALGKIRNPQSAIRSPRPRIGMSSDVLEAADTLRTFLFEKVYIDNSPDSDTARAKELVRALYLHFFEHPQQLPAEFQARTGPIERSVVDYIASMTDRYAFRVFAELHLPRFWPGHLEERW